MQATDHIQAAAWTRGSDANAEPLRMRKRVGSTVYEVRMHFNQDAKETMTDKILRLVRNDLNNLPSDVNMALPQTSRLPERSSL